MFFVSMCTSLYVKVPFSYINGIIIIITVVIRKTINIIFIHNIYLIFKNISLQNFYTKYKIINAIYFQLFLVLSLIFCFYPS